MIVVYHPAFLQREDGVNSGHYYSCNECGWCSKIYTGEDSRLRAVVAARLHQQAKTAARDADVIQCPNT